VAVNSCASLRGLLETVKQWASWTVKSADRDPLALWLCLLMLLLSVPVLEHVVQLGFGRPLCCWPLCLVAGLALDRGDRHGKDQCRKVYPGHGHAPPAAENQCHPAPSGGGGTTYPV